MCCWLMQSQHLTWTAVLFGVYKTKSSFVLLHVCNIVFVFIFVIWEYNNIHDMENIILLFMYYRNIVTPVLTTTTMVVCTSCNVWWYCIYCILNLEIKCARDWRES